jgi:predicted metalloendopeptidase
MRTRISNLAHHIRQTLIDTVNANTWLSAADRHVLVKKLMSILIRVAEPDEWQQEPFAGQIASDRYDHNLNLIRKYRVERNLQLASTSSLREAVPFAMPLDAVNAYYAADSNTITILAGILQLPFFSIEFNRVSEYAILGSIIGHELSHALDAHGLFWDHEGSLRPEGIISREGMQAFANRTKCLIQDYQEAEGAACPNYGVQTLSENIADVTGIELAYKALEASSMSDRQYFYFVLAQGFCESPPQAGQIHSCSTDPHSSSNFRIDLVFRNMPDFATTFNCAPGQRMYKEQGDKCRIY